MRVLISRWFHYIQSHPDRERAVWEFQQWLLTTTIKKDMITNGLPWITWPAIAWLDGYLRPDMTVFEWGSGGSTVFFAERVGHVISVEHDNTWFQLVQQRITGNRDNVELIYQPPEVLAECPLLPSEEIVLYRSSNVAFADQLFYSYVRGILSYPDSYFDVVMVDGRARVGCVRTAPRKVKTGGVMMLDNSDRERYYPVFTLLKEPEWTVLHLDGPGPNSVWPVFSCTTVFIKN